MKVADEILWTCDLRAKIAAYVSQLADPAIDGCYMPCQKGLTPQGRLLKLGFSCLALKTMYMLGEWESYSEAKKKAWITFIQAFQTADGSGIRNGAFIDPACVSALEAGTPLFKRWTHAIFYPKGLTAADRVIMAETKQAIATLIEIGHQPLHPYKGFPRSIAGMRERLMLLPWTQPWSAGGQAAALAVFVRTQAPHSVDLDQCRLLEETLADFFGEIADPRSGAYFMSEKPAYGQLVNGAMKVLTALDWLDIPIHYPERLIDTCLSQLPDPTGCHLVDWVYCLYRASRQTTYRLEDIREMSGLALDTIRSHHNPDGGFSYHVGKSRPFYYGVRVSKKLAESDLHGTCLLTWAVGMIHAIYGTADGWKVIKP